MTDMLETARILAGQFRDSGLYRDYCNRKKALEANPLLFERIRAYKKCQYELESKRLNEGGVSFDEERRVAYQYTDLSLDPVAGAFLDSEHELLEAYRIVLDIISEACEID